MEEYEKEMFVVSIGGLIVNIMGLFFLSEDDDQQSSLNIKGLFLHVLADTFRSIGVLLNCFLVRNYGITMADPLCAMFVSVMIFISVLPLLKASCVSLIG